MFVGSATATVSIKSDKLAPAVSTLPMVITSAGWFEPRRISRRNPPVSLQLKTLLQAYRFESSYVFSQICILDKF